MQVDAFSISTVPNMVAGPAEAHYFPRLLANVVDVPFINFVVTTATVRANIRLSVVYLPPPFSITGANRVR